MMFRFFAAAISVVSLRVEADVITSKSLPRLKVSPSSSPPNPCRSSLQSWGHLVITEVQNNRTSVAKIVGEFHGVVPVSRGIRDRPESQALRIACQCRRIAVLAAADSQAEFMIPAHDGAAGP